MKKIAIIEDDLGISASLKLYLENSDFDVISHNTGDKAPEFIISETPDLVILDINLPIMDGIDVCSEVRKNSEVPIIMLTARTWEMDRVTGLESGADDYIAKPFSPRELLARINSILRRSHNESEAKEQNIITHDNVSINRETMEMFVDKKIVSITKNEFDILEKIFTEDGKLVTRETLMTEVIGYDNYVYDRTIDTHIKNLRKKIGNKDMILTIRGKWYRLNK
jgi:DNA-binding response OmpR family regulator